MNPANDMPPLEPSEPAPPAAEEPHPFWGWDDVLLLAGGILPAILFATLIVRFGSRLIPGVSGSKLVPMLAVQSLFYVLLLGALWFVIAVKHRQPFWRSLNWRFPFRGMGFALFLGPILAVSVGVLGLALKAPRLSMPFEDAITGTASIVMLGLFVALLGPVFEELVFRGFLYPLLERSLGVWPALVAAALPFALLHGPQYQWSWQHLLLVGYAGVVFGWMRVSTGSTAAAAFTHATYNLFFYSAFVAQSTRGPV